MALKYPDRLESNNPSAYGIVKATEVTGHKTVNTKLDLLSLADAILSDSKTNSNNDAIGLQWYVYSEKCFYQLIDWNNRKIESGWKKVLTDTSLNESITSILNSLNAHKSDTNNPHSVTKAQVGLSNVDNTSDLNKPISTATQTKLDTKVDKVNNKSLVSDSEITKLSLLPNKATLDSSIADAKKTGTDALSNLNNHLKNYSNPHLVTKALVGLENVDNTSDANKPISTATLNALNNKVDKVSGKLLSTEDYTTAEKLKLSSLLNYNDTELRGLIDLKMNILPIKLTNEDLNNITTPGFYYASEDNTVLNKPSNIIQFYLHVYKSGTFIHLDLRDSYGVNNEKYYSRTKDLTKWYDWLLYPSNFLDPPVNNQVLVSNSIGLLKSSGFTIAKSVPADAKFTDTIYNDTEIKNELKTKLDSVKTINNESITGTGNLDLDTRYKKTTIGGYGITDAKLQNGTVTLGADTLEPLTDEQINNMFQ